MEVRIYRYCKLGRGACVSAQRGIHVRICNVRIGCCVMLPDWVPFFSYGVEGFTFAAPTRFFVLRIS